MISGHIFVAEWVGISYNEVVGAGGFGTGAIGLRASI